MLGSPGESKGVDSFGCWIQCFIKTFAPLSLECGVAVRSWICCKDKFPAQVAIYGGICILSGFVVSLQHVYSSIMLNEKTSILWKHVPLFSQSWKWKTLIQSNLFFGNPFYTSMIMLGRAIHKFLGSWLSLGFLFAVLLWKIISLCQLTLPPPFGIFRIGTRCISYAHFHWRMPPKKRWHFTKSPFFAQKLRPNIF